MKACHLIFSAQGAFNPTANPTIAAGFHAEDYGWIRNIFNRNILLYNGFMEIHGT
jgi:hypothetical protein